ncbi:MAG TPA: dUTP diphosphatase [Acidobacteriaceae bacterium]|jgi:dUTP pyrophosphatase
MPQAVRVKRLHPDAMLPDYQSAGAACFDLHTLNAEHVTRDSPAVCRTGLAFEVPEGYVMLVYSRSGHGFKAGVRLSNCVGVIDSDYRGEVMVKLTSDGGSLTVSAGDRIAQAMIVPVPRVRLEWADELSDTHRGEGGMGSTG